MNAYCTVAEVGTLGINADAIRDIEPDVITTEIQAQSAVMDTYFVDRFALPLTAVDLSVKKCCAALTGAALLRTRGTGPEDGDVIEGLTGRWTRWLEGVAAGKWRPTVTDSSTAPPATSGSYGARVLSASSRGLSVRGTGRCRQPFQGD